MLVQTITLNMERVVIMYMKRAIDESENGLLFWDRPRNENFRASKPTLSNVGRIIVFIISIGYCMLVLTTASIQHKV